MQIVSPLGQRCLLGCGGFLLISPQDFARALHVARICVQERQILSSELRFAPGTAATENGMSLLDLEQSLMQLIAFPEQ